MTDTYNPASRPCSNGPQPGTTALQKATLAYFPSATNVGTFVCRNNAGGAPSVHGNGRAGDIGFNGPLGQIVADWLVKNHTTLDVQLVICNHRIWSVARAAEGWRPYGCDKAGSPLDHHTTHVHWEQNIDGGRRVTRAICDTVRPGTPSKPTPTEPKEPWMKNSHYMLTPDGGGIIVFDGYQGKTLGTPDEFNLLVANGWISAHNPANDQERMRQPIFDFLTRK